MIEERLKPYIAPRFLTDERYRRGHINIVAAKPGTVILGLHTPEMKALAREFVRSGEWQSLVAEFAKRVPVRAGDPQPLAHEERIIWGLMLDYAKVDFASRCRLIEAFLPAIDNWAICDTFCCNSAWAAKAGQESLWGFLDRLFAVSPGSRDYEFTLRVGLILAMCHSLDADGLPRTFAKLRALRLPPESPYYVRMGAAWLLATALAKHPDPARRFVSDPESGLPADIVKLYIRKARESRITRDLPPLSGPR